MILITYYIGFQAGEDASYTLTFNHQNVDSHYDVVYLVDLVENSVTDISSKAEAPTRFRVTPNSAAQNDSR